jgi:serine phosphatase RsbU (regulator of sigma subunit)
LALSLQERELSLKKRESELKSHEIAEQKRHITIMIIAIVMGIVAIFFIYRSYTISRKTNVKLTDLNKSLKQHKDEIFLQKTIVEEKKKEITDSIYYAQRIQKSLLPSIKSFDDILKDNFILFKPKDIVSGDFYWFQKIGQDKVLFTVVDCTGHGVPGALMSVIGINQLNKIVHENKIIQPNTILQELDFATRATLRQANNEDNANDGMEMSICLLDTTSKTLHYSGAFNPLWIVSSQSNTTLEKYKTPALPNTNTALYEIPADKKSIAGMYKFHHQFTLHTVQLQKGDCIYLFSDGFADQFGGKDGKKFKKQQLKEKLVSVHTKNMLQQQDELNTVFESWKGNFEQIDDVCLMGIKIN